MVYCLVLPGTDTYKQNLGKMCTSLSSRMDGWIRYLKILLQKVKQFSVNNNRRNLSAYKLFTLDQ